jgi:monoamine oxidase
MSHSAKIAVAPTRDVWRCRGWAGRVVSHAGPLREVHDATTEGHPALAGFADRFGDDEAVRARAGRQLQRLFGEAFGSVRIFAACDWSREPFTTPPDEADRGPSPVPPADVSALRLPLWDGILHLASAETATQHPGYLDGAIEAGQRAAAAARRRLRVAPAP